jgi:hypothetical protein
LKKDLILNLKERKRNLKEFYVVRYEEESKDKSGIGPVVATVILVAFTIFVAVAVAYGSPPRVPYPTHYEKIQISSAYATYDSNMNTTGGWVESYVLSMNRSIYIYISSNSSLSGWVVTINMQNTGAADATISNLLINGKPWNDASYSDATGRYVCNISPSTLTSTGLALLSGQSATITFHIVKGLGFTSGVTVEITLHSESGQDYPTTITLS